MRAVGTINVLGSELGRPVLQVGIQGKDLLVTACGVRLTGTSIKLRRSEI